MALRQTRLITKNSDIVNRPLPSSLLQGEAIVNTAEGIMFFSGVTTSTTEWTPAGTGATEQTFFEVGSNLYRLKIRDKITSYNGVTNLTGKFLSGTSTGFVLADTSNINGISGFTYNPSNNTFTITDASGDNYDATLQSVTGLTVNGDLVVSAITANTLTVNGVNITGDTFVSGGTYYTGGTVVFNYNTGGNFQVTGLTQDLNNEIASLAETDEKTITLNTTTNKIELKQIVEPSTGGTRTFQGNVAISGGTLNLNTIGAGSPVINLGLDSSGEVVTGTSTGFYVTAFTYNNSNNTFTISDSSGSTFDAAVNVVSGLTVSNLTNGRVVYVGSSGLLKDESAFTYNDGTDTLSVTNIEAAGDVVVQGSLTVFGPSISAFTSNLYVEDSNITLNFNPTGSTTLTSVNAGFTIQDGNGISSGDVNLDVVRMQNLTGLTSTEVPNVSEYVSLTGYVNRGWVTQLNDIVIRSTDANDDGSFNGVRVLGEFDILSGGFY